MAKRRHSVPDKYVQTSLDNYFAVKSQASVTPKEQDKGKRKMKERKKRSSTSLSNIENVIKNVSVEKRNLPVPMSSDEDEGSGIENECSLEPNRANWSPPGMSTPKKSRQEHYSESVGKTCNESPSTSALQSPNKSSNSSAKQASIVSKNITILANVLISPAKPELKKVNYTTLRVFKEFFLNIVKSDHLKYLLDTAERDMLYIFFNSEKNCQYTCIKLFMWKTQYYNIFRYMEKIGLQLSDNEVSTIYNFLKENKFVETEYLNDDLPGLLNLLSLKELREIQRTFKFSHPSTTKDLIVAKLIKHCKAQGTLTTKKSTEQVLRDRVCEKLGFCVKLSENLAKALNNVYILNTFTNPDFLRIQDYFKDLNIVYPNYHVESLQIFGRNEFLKYSEALEQKRELENAIEKKNIANILVVCRLAFSILENNSPNDEENCHVLLNVGHLERFTAHYQYVAMLSRGSEFVRTTNFKEVQTWVELLLSQKSCSHKRGSWYCTLSLIHSKYLKEYESAAKLVISAFENEKDHLSEVQKHELAFRGNCLHKKTYNLPALLHDKIASLCPPPCDRNWPAAFIESKTIRNNEPGQKRKYVQELPNGDKHYLTVEQVALEHYRKSGFPDGVHCEGNIVCAAFCLLFWDIIYGSYVKGAFISDMQTAPLDMYTKYFYINRQTCIKSRLNSIRTNWEDEELKKLLLHNWDQHSHESSLCAIDSVVSNGEKLYHIIECIGRHMLTKIFERLVKNYKVYRSGLPDLIVWNYEAKKCKFVEVKGENDHLSIKQKLWMNYLMDIGASVELCNVHSTGSKKKTKKNKDD